MPVLPKTPAIQPAVPTGPQFDNRRVLAALIDLMIPLAAVAAASAAGLSLTRGLLLVGLGWTLYYFFALESGDGQTLGKRVMKLRVVSADGTPASMEQIAKRTIVRILDGHIVGLIVMLATGDRRMRLGDIVAGTVVTDAESTAAPQAPTEVLQHAAAPVAPAEATAPKRSLLKRPIGKPSFSKPTFNKPTFNKPSFNKPSFNKPALRKPASGRLAFLKRPIGMPSLGRRSGGDADEVRPAATESASQTKQPSFLKRPIAMPSFGKRSKPDVGVDKVGFPAVASPEAIHEPEEEQPLPPEPADEYPTDRLTDALRAATPPEAEPLEPFEELAADPAPYYDYDTPAPDVELDASEPATDFDTAEPLVEVDTQESWSYYYGDEPDPLADFGGREPVVEVDAPEPDLPSPAELEPWAEATVDAGPDPRLPDEPEDDSRGEAGEEPVADGDPETEMTIKPVETVSAIDLVMQDAEDERPPGR